MTSKLFLTVHKYMNPKIFSKKYPPKKVTGVTLTKNVNGSVGVIMKVHKIVKSIDRNQVDDKIAWWLGIINL